MRRDRSHLPPFISVLLFSIVSLLCVRGSAQSCTGATCAAASCTQSDVLAAMPSQSNTNPTVTVNIPACSPTTWKSSVGIAVPSGVTNLTITGNGTPQSGGTTFGMSNSCNNTTIVDNGGSSVPIFWFTLSYGQTVRLSCLDIEPTANTTIFSPISFVGTCSASGCPQMRVDNIGFGLTTPWTEGGNGGNPADWLIREDNMVGVIDHITVPNNNGVDIFNASFSKYLGVGDYGDNSWATPDSFGGPNNLFFENNIVSSNQQLSDCEAYAYPNGGLGGCRYVGRFNQIGNVSYQAFGTHGLDTDGRPRGGRQIEAYGNTITCTNGSGGCGGGVAGYRSGTGLVFGNTLTANNGSWFNNIANVTIYRNVYQSATKPWGACGGSSPYDSNDGNAYYTGTVSSVQGTDPNFGEYVQMTDSGKSWTAHQFIPAGAPYSVHDITGSWWGEIADNTSNQITIRGAIQESFVGQTYGFQVGDSYEILRSKVCADQAARGQGNYVSGSTPSPAAALNQALDPIYEWDNAGTHINQGNIGFPGEGTGRLVANHDYYTDNSNGNPQEQTSPTSPFNGSKGVGFGTLANRPTSCTPQVGYWATDQGSWNQSGNGFGQGELFICTATDTWSLSYTPYTYPHPLNADSVVSPPTGLTALVQ